MRVFLNFLTGRFGIEFFLAKPLTKTVPSNERNIFIFIFRKATKLALDRLKELSVKIDKENKEVIIDDR